MMYSLKVLGSLAAVAVMSPCLAQETSAQDDRLFRPIDVFQLENASDPQVSPDGTKIVYVRNRFDIMKDRRRTNLWIIDYDGSDHRPLTSGNRNDMQPRWSPDGRQLLYASSAEGSVQLYVRWMDTGQVAKLTDLTRSPGSMTWSPDGQWIAFSMLVPEASRTYATMPKKPKGADWAEPAIVIDSLQYRADGAGYLESGYHHLFVIPAEGGTPRQVTKGNFEHRGAPAWTPDGEALIFAANRRPGWEYEGRNTEIHRISLQDGSITTLTDRNGPDSNPIVSPDGRKIAYLGFDDRLQGYQVTDLNVMSMDGGESRCLSSEFDRDVASPIWASDSSSLYFQYDDRGHSRVARMSLDGSVTDLGNELGGTSLGRPYSGGSFSVSGNGMIAYTLASADRPADVAVVHDAGGEESPVNRLTSLNEDLFGHKDLGAVEEFWCESSFDQRKIQAWIVKPPKFDPEKDYPLILEIHGGPFANYGFRFSAEAQLYAAAGYVVLYANPRGSTSYGQEFGNLIHHHYPSEDYDDLMSWVDAVLSRGYVDRDQLYVTGGSGGGVLSSWIVGKTDRFRAAVVAKPVINWYSFVLTADSTPFFYKYWFPGFPWDHQDHYMKRSPLSLVGNVTTPTMLLTGEADYRTPISESEQYYAALKLRKVDAALVRIPGASHGITARPSNLIAKVAHILKWFEEHSAGK
ncbi:MAG: prolyl oligopeptidase family serine peptidase [Planctomycetota bacterium]